MWLSKKYLIISVTLLVVVHSLNHALAMLIFFVAFQLVAGIIIIRQIRFARKIKNGPFTMGHLKEMRKINAAEDDIHNFEGILEFQYPEGIKTYTIKHKFSSFYKPSSSKSFKIWVNEQNPADSVALEEPGWYWVMTIIVFTCLICWLFYLDILYLHRL